MKLIKYSSIPSGQKNSLTTIIGFQGNIPAAYAKHIKKHGWEILESQTRQMLSERQELTTVSIENSRKDVLEFFKKTGLVPFCIADKNQDLRLNKSFIKEYKNRRQYPRKKVKLKGNFFNKRNKYRGGFRTRDISLRGIKFQSQSDHDIVLGDTLMVDYVLNNSQSTKIIRDVKTVYINKKQVGAEIINPPLLDPDLGFYLMD